MKSIDVRTRKYRIGQLRALVIIVLTFGVAAPNAFAAKLYKWVDDQGNVSYQDQPPPSNGKIIKESELVTNNAEAAEENGPAPVIIYTIDDCDSCEVLKLRLQQLAIPFEEQSLLSRDVQRDILTQSDSLLAPTLFFNEKYVNGLSDDELIAELRLGGFEPTVDDQQIDVINPDDALEIDEDGDVLTDEQLGRE